MSHVPEPVRKKAENKNLQLRATVNSTDMKKCCFGGFAERHREEYSDYASIFKSMSKKWRGIQYHNMKIPQREEGRGLNQLTESTSNWSDGRSYQLIKSFLGF